MADQERAYAHHINTDLLLKAVTATPEEFREKEETYREQGIERVSPEKLKEDFGIRDEYYCTVISNATVGDPDETIAFTDLNEQVIPSILFSDCRLHEFRISNSELYRSEDANTNIHLINTKASVIIIRESTFGDFSIRRESITEYIRIIKSRIGVINIRESSTENFSIREESKTGDFVIKKATIGNFTIENATTGGFKIEESKTGHFLIKKSITGYFWIRKSTTEFISIRESTTENFSIWDKSITGRFRIWEDSTTGRFQSIESLIAGISIKSSIIPHLRVSNCNILHLECTDQSRTEAFIRDSLINLLDFTQTVLPIDTTISFSSVRIYACLLEEVTVLGNLYFRNVTSLDKPVRLLEKVNESTAIQPVYSSPYVGHSYLQKRNALTFLRHYLRNKIIPEEEGITSSTFRITYSSLGHTEFIDSDLAGFDTFEFKHSRINQIFISGLKTPETVRIPGLTEDDEEWYEQNVSFYNQLSRISEQQGFIYSAVTYRSKSARYQQQRLKKKLQTGNNNKEAGQLESKKWSDKIIRKATSLLNVITNFSKNIIEYIPFFLNAISNKHGDSWGRATIFFIGSTVFCYVLYLLLLGHAFSFQQHIDWSLVGYYFEFINPLRSIDFMKNSGFQLNWAAKGIDFLARLVIAYGIYQFVTAFRKYKKK